MDSTPNLTESEITEYSGSRQYLDSYDLKSIKKLISKIYKTKYYWELCKSTIVFLLALEIARECDKLVIPMKEYKPFS